MGIEPDQVLRSTALVLQTSTHSATYLVLTHESPKDWRKRAMM